VHADVSSVALCAPVIPSIRSLGSRLINEAGRGVLAHRQDNLEIRKFRGGVILVRERFLKENDFSARQ
jgi:hypothetical protein